MKRVVAIGLALIICLSAMAVLVCAAPETLNSLAIVGEGIPGVAIWDPADPNGDMQETSESVFTRMITFDTPGSMKFKVAGNDYWDDRWNFGGTTGGEEIVLGEKMDLFCASASCDLTLTVDDPGDYLITVDLTPMAQGGAATILVEEDGVPEPPQEPTTAPTEPTEPEPTEPIGETRTLTVEIPDNWPTVYAYTWEPFTLGDFPGTQMQKISDNTYEYQIDASMINLVLNNGVVSAQTCDIRLPVSGDVRIRVNDDCSYTILEEPNDRAPIPPVPPIIVSNYRVVGNADWLGNWDPAFDGGRMYELGDECYRVVFGDVAPGTYEIKITKDGIWDGAYGAENGQNFVFTVSHKCNITIDLTIKDGQGVIEVYGLGWIGDYEDDEEENPKTSDVSTIVSGVLLTSCAVALPVVLYKRKKTQ